MRADNIIISRNKNISNVSKLGVEFKTLNPTCVTVAKFNDSELRFYFSENPNFELLGQLDNLLETFQDNEAHNALPKIISIAKEEAKSKHFHNIDYKIELTQSLIPKRTVSKGEVTKVEWFKSIDEKMNPYDLVLVVDIVYTRDASGFATSRTTTRTWINDDESENEHKKITNKYYFINQSDMIDEGLKRRKLLVNSIQIPTLTFMSEALIPLGYNQSAVLLFGREFMDNYESDFSKFIENSSTITNPADPDYGKKSVIVELSKSIGRNEPYNIWLDKAPPSLGGTVTIRQYLINEFSI